MAVNLAQEETQWRETRDNCFSEAQTPRLLAPASLPLARNRVPLEKSFLCRLSSLPNPPPPPPSSFSLHAPVAPLLPTKELITGVHPCGAGGTKKREKKKTPSSRRFPETSSSDFALGLLRRRGGCGTFTLMRRKLICALRAPSAWT